MEKTVIISNVEYQLSILNCDDGLDALIILGRLLSNIKGVENIDINELNNIENLLGIVKNIFGNKELKKDLFDLINIYKKYTIVRGKGKLETIYQTHFSNNYYELFMWIIESSKFNFMGLVNILNKKEV